MTDFHCEMKLGKDGVKLKKKLSMDGWMDGWDRQVDDKPYISNNYCNKNRQVYGWMNKLMNEQMDRWIERRQTRTHREKADNTCSYTSVEVIYLHENHK